MVASKLIDAFSEVSKTDLETVEKAISDNETQLIFLRELRRVLIARLGLKPPTGAAAHVHKGPAKKRPAASPPDAAPVQSELTPADAPVTATDRHRQNAYRYIMANGASQPKDICKHCDIPAGSITAVLSHHWFKRTPRGVELVD